jgi:hypothetical protein
MDILAISHVLLDAASGRSQILGTHLGAALANSFPTLRDDPTYPGLKRFIQAHLADKLIRIADHGGDDVYRLLREGENSETIAPNQSDPTGVPTAWFAFQHPRSSFHVYVDPSSGALKVVSTNDSPPEGLRLIRSVTPAEHRQVAERFLERLPPSHDSEFREALRQEDYWSHWYRLVNRSEHKTNWNTFRFEELRALFEARLHELGFNDELQRECLRELLHSKKDSKSSETPRAPKQNRASVAVPVENCRDLRQLVGAVIEAMGEHELRAIWLPLGAVIDVIDSRRN